MLTDDALSAISAFANEAAATREMRILRAIWLTVMTDLYGTYLAHLMRENAKKAEIGDTIDDKRAHARSDLSGRKVGDCGKRRSAGRRRSA
jgi:hypothetical protein